MKVLIFSLARHENSCTWETSRLTTTTTPTPARDNIWPRDAWLLSSCHLSSEKKNSPTPLVFILFLSFKEDTLFYFFFFIEVKDDKMTQVINGYLLKEAICLSGVYEIRGISSLWRGYIKTSVEWPVGNPHWDPYCSGRCNSDERKPILCHWREMCSWDSELELGESEQRGRAASCSCAWEELICRWGNVPSGFQF